MQAPWACVPSNMHPVTLLGLPDAQTLDVCRDLRTSSTAASKQVVVLSPFLTRGRRELGELTNRDLGRDHLRPLNPKTQALCVTLPERNCSPPKYVK